MFWSLRGWRFLICHCEGRSPEAISKKGQNCCERLPRLRLAMTTPCHCEELCDEAISQKEQNCCQRLPRLRLAMTKGNLPPQFSYSNLLHKRGQVPAFLLPGHLPLFSCGQYASRIISYHIPIAVNSVLLSWQHHRTAILFQNHQRYSNMRLLR